MEADTDEISEINAQVLCSPLADKFILDRMPLIFPKEKISAWISPDNKPETILPYALSDMPAEKA